MNTEAFITPEEFGAALDKTGARHKPMGVAVSGGGDSVALALLLAQAGVTLRAFTVDHGLRAESAAEARHVHDTLTAHGIAHEILTWGGDKPATHVQERARDARYALMFDACRRHSLTALAVAHNLEDQAETFWMRLSHGSGIDGLAGMDAVSARDGLTIIRPVLGFSRARLRATCQHFGAAWVDDPSNTNEKYLRPKLRAFEDMLAGEGFTPERLALVMRKLGDAADALETMTNTAAAGCLVLNPEGYATLKRDAWKEQPPEIQRRLLARALSSTVAQDYPTGFEQLETARRALMDDGFKGQTLGGCEITRVKGGDALIIRQIWAAAG